MPNKPMLDLMRERANMFWDEYMTSPQGIKDVFILEEDISIIKTEIRL